MQRAMGQLHGMMGRHFIEVMSVGMAMLSEMEFVIACALYPGASGSECSLLNNLCLNIFDRRNGDWAAIYAEQVRGVRHEMDMGIVEARNDRSAFAVEAFACKQLEVSIPAYPDYLVAFHSHQLSPGPATVHGQHIGIIENKVCSQCDSQRN
jgi:hypothetical protein